MHELVEKILFGVGFIAIGGAVALMFFFVFAPSILGSKAIHKQLDRLQQEAELMNKQLKKIGEHLGEEKGKSGKDS